MKNVDKNSCAQAKDRNKDRKDVKQTRGVDLHNKMVESEKKAQDFQNKTVEKTQTPQKTVAP